MICFLAAGAVEDDRNNWGEQNEKYLAGGEYMVISSTFFPQRHK